MHDAIVIGAGHNGLTCAFYLARRGMKVAVLEAAASVGGAAVTDEFLPGFRNSAASYTVSLLQPKVIRDMDLERHGLNVVLRKTDNFLPGEGDYLLSGRGGLTRREIARHDKRDAEAYDRYLAELEIVVRLLKKWLLRAPPNVGRNVSAIPKLLSLGRDMAGLSLAETRIVHDFAVRSASDILDRHFHADLTKALFGFDGIVGNFASPQSPGTAYVLLHHLFGEAAGVPGAWGHAIGGMGSITQAMARACREVGVDILLNTPVEEIIVNRGRASGVVAGGKAWSAGTVVAGVNPKLLFDRLVPEGAVDDQTKSRMHAWKCESATFRMNVALSQLPTFSVLPKKGNHLTAGIIMAPSLDYMDRAYLGAATQGWSDRPIIEMLLPSTLDSTLAPKGKHVASLFCQHFRFDLGPGRSWDLEREKAADRIIATVDAHAPGFAASVLGRQIHSPLDLERRFGLIGGDIFHGKMGLDQLFSARPMIGAADYRMPLKGLYLCGSGAHPGGGFRRPRPQCCARRAERSQLVEAAPLKPLEDLRILDLSRVLAGPWCTQLLADLGAEVIKIERPGVGDDTRHWGPPWFGEGDSRVAAYFLSCNRGKKSAAIDFAQPEGARFIQMLAEQADVVVENFKVGALGRFGLDAKSLRSANPRLIFVSITGFGQDGPYAHRAGYDFIIQGMGGMMSVTGLADGEPGGGPMRAGVAIADLFTGLYSCVAILAALHRRDKTNEGATIDMALFDTQLAVMANQASNALVSGIDPHRQGNTHPNIVPYQPFDAADQPIIIAVGNDPQFARLAAICGHPEWASDERFAKNSSRVANRAQIVGLISQVISTKSAADWLRTLELEGIPAGPINGLSQAMSDIQAEHRQMIGTIAGVPQVASPIKLDGERASAELAPPELGADTSRILAELGVSPDEIERLRAAKVVG